MQWLVVDLSKLNAATLAAIVALAGATGAVVSAIISTILSKLFLGARDRQDREAEWRKHAIELTKLDLERKLKSVTSAAPARPLRPSILDFLANYRDLSELGRRPPGELYETIKQNRINKLPPAQPAQTLPEETSPPVRRAVSKQNRAKAPGKTANSSTARKR